MLAWANIIGTLKLAIPTITFVKDLEDIAIGNEKNDAIDKQIAEIACNKGYDDILQLLIKKNPNAVFDKYYLISAVKQGHSNVVRVLIDGGANVDIYSDSDKVSLLELAVIKGRREIVRLLINANANIIHKNNDRALRLALQEKQDNIFIDLVVFGANVYVNDNLVIELAIRSNNSFILRYLFSRYFDIHQLYNFAINVASDCDNQEIIKLLRYLKYRQI